MKDSVDKTVERKVRRLALPSLLVLVVAAVSFGTALFGGAWLRRSVAEMEERRRETSVRCVARGLILAESSMDREAFKYFQLGLAAAQTRNERIRAGLAIGEFLRDRARREPYPNAMMACQYLEAVLDLGPDSADMFRCYRALMDTAICMGEVRTAVAACRQALQYAPNDEAVAELLLDEMDLLLQRGTWHEMDAALTAAARFDNDPMGGYRFQFRRALAGERVLSNEDWFREWAEVRGVRDAKAARADLITETVNRFRGLQECGVVRVMNEAMFRAARLLYQEGHYADAEEYLYAFLEREAGMHQGEALLIMTGLARIKEKPEEAGDRMAVFLKRFLWNASASREFRQVVEQVINGGQLREALSLIDEYMKLPIAESQAPDLLYLAGEAAVQLKEYVRADRYFDKILALQPGNDMVVKTMLARADVCRRQNDLEGAQQWLVKYLNRFPYEKSYGDALYSLLDVELQRGVGAAEVINLAIAAANETPRDERSMNALMAVAHELELMGLAGVAQKQYNKIALLSYVGTDKSSALRQAGSGAGLAEAMLGSARCLLKLGLTLNADRLLRDLCNGLEPCALRSEAALLWAGMALANEQDMEAGRRLNMVDSESAEPEIAAGAAFKRLLLAVDPEKDSAAAIDDLLKQAQRMPADKRSGLVREAYVTLFRRLAENQSVIEMRTLFEKAVGGDDAAELPLQEFSLQLGRVVLAVDGLERFIECMEKNGELIEKAGQKTPPEVVSLLAMARSIHKHRVTINTYL